MGQQRETSSGFDSQELRSYESKVFKTTVDKSYAKLPTTLDF